MEQFTLEFISKYWWKTESQTCRTNITLSACNNQISHFLLQIFSNQNWWHKRFPFLLFCFPPLNVLVLLPHLPLSTVYIANRFSSGPLQRCMTQTHTHKVKYFRTVNNKQTTKGAKSVSVPHSLISWSMEGIELGSEKRPQFIDLLWPRINTLKHSDSSREDWLKQRSWTVGKTTIPTRQQDFCHATGSDDPVLVFWGFSYTLWIMCFFVLYCIYSSWFLAFCSVSALCVLYA